MVDCERWDGRLWDRYDHEMVDCETNNEMVDCETETDHEIRIQ